MTAHHCEGPCNRGARQARYDYEDAVNAWQAAITDWEAANPDTRGDRPERPAEPDIEWVSGDPVWCGRCRGAIRVALADLENLAALVAAESDGHRGRGDDSDRVRASKSAPSPSPAADTLDELYGFLATTEADWREAREYGPRPERSRGAAARTVVIAWLREHLDDILNNHGSAPFGIGVLRWQRVLQHLAKARPPGRRKPVPCPRCDRRTLVHEEDRDLIRCENPSCGRVMTTTDYDAHVAEQGKQVTS
ncbi:hypothetical protein [Nocardiopsis sp. YSL2]|uniref:hypothetical protein n=1 Tax=Nocardiopsis sp. YSL2 TaxID=2939492 RepID=UPI0026F4221B|nr:hypothetical protein [Nocardiopsis sp. YSL2]